MPAAVLPAAAADRPARPHVRLPDHVLVAGHAAVDPRLYADRPVGREGDGVAVVHVGLEGGQRDGALALLLLAGDFRPAEPAAHAELDPLGPGLHGAVHPLLEDAAE